MRAQLRGALIGIRRAAVSRESVTLHPAVRLIELGAAGFDTFFGYHDLTPFDLSSQRILSVQCPSGLSGRVAGTPLTIGTFDLSTDAPAFEPFAVSSAWCWQQGCRLQWYPSHTDAAVFFNISEKGVHRSRIVDARTAEVLATIDCAIYALDPTGQFGVSLNFARLQRLRPGYGYDDVSDSTCDAAAPDQDGLSLVDMGDGTRTLILSLAEMASYRPSASMQGATHYFNHVLWSPLGSRFFFLHVWQSVDGCRYSRAFIWDTKTETYSLLGRSQGVSHHCWVDDDRIIAFATEAGAGTGYHLYDVNEGLLTTIGKGVLQRDGHPSISPADTELLVTDTYRDTLGEQSVLLYDVRTNTLRIAASLYSPRAFEGERRCDLHPRWDRVGHRLCVDSAHRGERRLCVIDVAAILDRIHSL